MTEKYLCGMIEMEMDRKDGIQTIVQVAKEGQLHSKAAEHEGSLSHPDGVPPTDRDPMRS